MQPDARKGYQTDREGISYTYSRYTLRFSYGPYVLTVMNKNFQKNS
jgi:hypothetical protein